MARLSLPALALMAAAILRAGGETVQIVSGSPTPLSGVLAVFALLAFAFGLTGLRDPAGLTLTARIAMIATSLAIVGFVVIAIQSIFSGAPPVDTVAGQPLFVASSIAVLVGITALAVWLTRNRDYPRWLGPTMLVSVAGSVVASFLDWPPITQPLLDILMAATFLQFGLSMQHNTRHPPEKRTS